MNRKHTILIQWLLCLSWLGSTPVVAQNHNLEVGKNLDIFNTLYSQLDLFYVDSLMPEQTMTAAIRGMLRSLDPYTEYYPEQDQRQLEMMLTGKYAGIGALVKYHTRLGRVVIDEPYEGMPAAEHRRLADDRQDGELRQQSPARRPWHHLHAAHTAPLHRP